METLKKEDDFNAVDDILDHIKYEEKMLRYFQELQKSNHDKNKMLQLFTQDATRGVQGKQGNQIPEDVEKRIEDQIEKQRTNLSILAQNHALEYLFENELKQCDVSAKKSIEFSESTEEKTNVARKKAMGMLLLPWYNPDRGIILRESLKENERYTYYPPGFLSRAENRSLWTAYLGENVEISYDQEGKISDVSLHIPQLDALPKDERTAYALEGNGRWKAIPELQGYAVAGRVLSLPGKELRQGILLENASMRIYDSSGHAAEVSHVYYPPALLHKQSRAFWGKMQKYKGDKIIILHGENGNIQRFEKVNRCTLGLDYDNTLYASDQFRTAQSIPLHNNGWKGEEVKAFLRERGILEKIGDEEIKNIVCKITFEEKYKMQLKNKNKIKIPENSELYSALPQNTLREKALFICYADSMNTACICDENGVPSLQITDLNSPSYRLGRKASAFLDRSPENVFQEGEIILDNDEKMKRFYGNMITPTADCASSLFKNGCSLHVVTSRMGDSPFSKGNKEAEKERLNNVKQEICEFGLKNDIGFFHATNAFSQNMFCLYDDMALSAERILQENGEKQFGVHESYFFNNPLFEDFYKKNSSEKTKNLVVLTEKEKEEDVRKRLERWSRRHGCDPPSLKTGKDFEMYSFCIPQAIRVHPETGSIIFEVGDVLGKRGGGHLESPTKKRKIERSR